MGKHKSRRQSRRKSRKSSRKSRKSRKSRRQSSKSHRRRRFGSSEYGPGYVSDSGIVNAKGAAYFNSLEPFSVRSDWSIPIVNNQYQFQDPLYNFN